MDPRIDMLVTLLERHRRDLERAVAEVPAELRDVRPDDTAWSVGQVLEHLLVTERAITEVLEGFLAGASEREAGAPFDPDAFSKKVEMSFFLDRSRKVQGREPPGQLNAEQARDALTVSRAALLDMVARADSRRLEDFSRPHPATPAPLDAYQWIAFIALHEGRHALQVEEIASSLDAR